MPSSTYHPRVSASQMSSVRWTLAEDLEFNVNAGISLIGVTAHKLIDEPERGVERILTAGLQTSSVLAATVRVPLVDAGPTGALDALRPSIDIAAALDDAPCYFVSGPAPSRMPSDDAFELLVDALAPVVSYARECGVTLAIETSSTSTPISDSCTPSTTRSSSPTEPRSGCASSSRIAGTTAISDVRFESTSTGSQSCK